MFPAEQHAKQRVLESADGSIYCGEHSCRDRLPGAAEVYGAGFEFRSSEVVLAPGLPLW